MLGTGKLGSSAENKTRPQRGNTIVAAKKEAAGSAKRSEEIGALPLGERVKAVAPPLNPFRKGSFMSNPPSPSYRPEIPRKVVDIPNPSRLQSQREEASYADDSTRLVVGQSISVTGDISACETLVVQGTVEANLKDAMSIEVAEGTRLKERPKSTTPIFRAHSTAP